MTALLHIIRAIFFSVLILAFPSAYGVSICNSSSSPSTDATGTLTDSGGSGGNYSDGEECDFLIEPVGAGTITLTFSDFELESGYDFLTIYDGPADDSPVLANRLSGSSLPSSVTSTGGSMLVQFISDGSVTRSGFVSNWTSTTEDVENEVKMCGSTSSTDATGTLTDSGGSSGNYSNNEDCDFLINPVGDSPITLTFFDFDLESGYDFLTIYDGPTDDSPVLANRLSGTNLPASVTSSGGSMLVRFSSDGSQTRDGFIANWTPSIGGVCLAESVGDNFPNVSYSQNSGSENWSGNWIEVGESDGASAGIARVRSDLCTSGGGNCLRLGVPSGNSAQTYSNRGVFRETDLTGATSATLSFVYRRGVNQGSQTIVLSISNNGGSSWTDLQSYVVNSTNTSPVTASFDILAYATNETQIRFLASGNNAVAGMYIDDININYQPTCAPEPEPVVKAEWYLDEFSWNTVADEVHDSSGSDYHGVASKPMTTTADGVVCNAADFREDGTSDYVSLNSSALNGLDDFSISVWGKLDSSRSGEQTILSAASSTHFNSVLLYFLNTSTLQFHFRDTAVATYTLPPINDDLWHHYVWTRNEGNHCLFMDGVSQGCQTGSYTGDISISSGGLIIGQEQDSVGGTFVQSQDWEGLVDEPIIFSGELSAESVSSIYENQLAEKNWDGSERTCPVPVIHHYEIAHDGQGLTCDAETVTIKACTDESCSNSSLSTESVTLDFLVDGVLIDSPTFTGSKTVSFNNTDIETLTLSIDNATIIASDSVVCDDGSGSSCDMEFVSAGFRFLYGSSNSTAILNQTSGSEFSDTLMLQAVEDSDGVCVGLFNGTKFVDLSQENVEPGGTSGLSFVVNGINIFKPPRVTSTKLNFRGDSIAIIPTPIYHDAGKIRLHADYNVGGVALSGSSNSFWVSPAELVVSAKSGSTTLNGATATATPIHKAGEKFTLTVSAYNAATPAKITPNYSPGQIQFKLARTGPTLAESVDGNLTYADETTLETSTSPVFKSVTISSFSSGVSTYIGAKYSEVGLINLDIQDSNYGNNPSIVIEATAINIGRFIPDHFKQTITATSGSILVDEGSLTVNHNNFGTCQMVDWAYSGQLTDIDGNTQGSITYFNPPKLTIKAYNSADEITENYVGDFAKLMFLKTDTDNKISFKAAKTTHINGLTLTGSHELGEIINLGKGVLTYQLSEKDHFVYTRDVSSEIAPFKAAFELPFEMFKDSDGVMFKASTPTVDYFETPKFYQRDETPPAIPAFNNTVEIRFGRLALKNSFGPETSNLPQQLQVEYFVGGTSFVVNGDDNCTSYDASNIDLTDTLKSNSLDPLDLEAVVVNGNFIDGKTQEIALKFKVLGDESQGEVGVEYGTYDWLKFDWKVDGVYINPSATATFGLFRGNDRIIYMREVF